jgi:hypothetical protein
LQVDLGTSRDVELRDQFEVPRHKWAGRVVDLGSDQHVPGSHFSLSIDITRVHALL